jgi:hypothetical protein
VGVTGILKGTGKPEGWANKMMFYPDSLITDADLKAGLIGFEKTFPANYPVKNEQLTIARAWEMLTDMQHSLRLRIGISHKHPPIILDEWRGIFKRRLGMEEVDRNRLVTRKEVAIMIDELAQHPFYQRVDQKGNVVAVK